MRYPPTPPEAGLAHDFIDPRDGTDELTLRNEQLAQPIDRFRSLHPADIEILTGNGNTADDWRNVLVADPFDPHLVQGCRFHGLVRIGSLEPGAVETDGLTLPAGITDSRIISCDLGDHVAIHRVHHLARYIVRSNCALTNIDEMFTTSRAVFGQGILTHGDSPDTRIRIELVNEAGSRSVLPFDGMLPADAALWVRHRDDAELMARFEEMVQMAGDPRHGRYGTVGNGSAVRSCRCIRNVHIGEHAVLHGANRLDNLTIQSTKEEPTRIGHGVELVDGIVGTGCRVESGGKATRFVMGANCRLEYGACMLHTLLGDNSVVACCEIRNNLLFPAHSHNHSNAFLIASLLMGQSNIAAGATIGSNHNSRAPDGELHAGRGFWPGLCVSLKHSSRFASFTLLAKGDFPAELNVPLPFSLVSNDAANDRLLIMPAYWWCHNMYALVRNAWKFRLRDRRRHPAQHVEFDALAPDTADEIFQALELLEVWTAQARARQEGESVECMERDELAARGRALLTGPPSGTAGLQVLAGGIENSRRDVVILRPREGYHTYRDMLVYYAMRHLVAYMQEHDGCTVEQMAGDLSSRRGLGWVNLGGQLIRREDVDDLRSRIRDGRIATWPELHHAYDRLWKSYPADRQRHAWATLCEINQVDSMTEALWYEMLDRVIELQAHVTGQAFATRRKDHENAWRRATCESEQEHTAVVGKLEDNTFLRQMLAETEALTGWARSLKLHMR